MSISFPYVAGLFDGEGSVGLYYMKGRNMWRPVVSIDQKRDTRSAKLISEIAEYYGSRVYYSGPDCRFQLTRPDALRRFITDVAPFTILKRAQLIVLETWLDFPVYTYRVNLTLKALKRRA